jgi:GDP-4-dehydro-6-deoxy-D-mannose reductase
MSVLITGAAGFAGAHLIHELVSHGHDCVATDLAISAPLPGTVACESVDLRDEAAVAALVQTIQPEACVHMAGITSVPDGIAHPDLMLSVNVRGTVNLLNALRQHAPAVRLLTISTAHVYGTPPRDHALDEHAAMQPLSMYAISKAAADLATLACASHHGLQAMVARPNNHTGPGQLPRFVVAAFVQQVRDIAAGHADPVMRTGNLESERDFMDVRDVVRAYRLLLEKGQAGQAYNISSGRNDTIRHMLATLCRLAGVTPRLETDPALMRPTDWSPRLDTTRLAEDTGWSATIPFEQTLHDMLNATAQAPI